MKPFSPWKTAALVIATLVGILYALPNLYGEDPAVQISTTTGDPLPAGFADRIAAVLEAEGLRAKDSRADGLRWVVRLADPVDQLRAADALRRELARGHVVALNLAPRTPEWLSAIGGRPMALGLDLRGGVYFLLEVDVADVQTRAIGRLVNELPAYLRRQDIRYSARRQAGNAVVIEFTTEERLRAAQRAIGEEFPELDLDVPPNVQVPTLRARISESESRRILNFAVQQNLTTLRNRVNQLGVAEPLVQRQGANRIVVQLPGVQDTTRVKDLLGATATLEYRAVDQENDPQQAAASGIVPPGSELFFHRGDRRPYLLMRDVIASGDQLVDAAATVDQQTGSPAVSVTLDGVGARRMLAFTERNVGNPMAVLYRESEVLTSYTPDGEVKRERREIEEIISVATVRGVFGKRFQTTGLSSKEAHDLAILLRGGALAAPIDIVEERTVGPSLGADNIRQGQIAALIGLVAVLIFMAVYYRVFGLIANVALVLNLVILVAAMSLIQATLTMPGIAGIVLTLGMAVDANVLIYERIREELGKGLSPRAAMDAGYDRAFLTIADSQITTLIAAVVLFALGSGPVKGFAITLSIGIATSMFTSIIGTRAIAHLLFSRKPRLTDLPV
jgi:preprotein translocase subunit SecD